MSRLLSALALTLLLAPAAAHAGSTDTAGEARRVSAEMTKLAQRNAWAGAERSYVTLLALGAPISAADHRVGAMAARQAGDAAGYLARLQAAEAAESSPAGQAELEAFQGAFAPVELAIKLGSATLSAAERPFQTDRAAAIDYAAASVAATGRFTGWLPAGQYALGSRSFGVAPGVELTRVDTRAGTPAPEACGATRADQLVDLLNRADAAFEARDKAALRGAFDQVLRALPCLTDEAVGAIVARTHRVQGLVAGLDDPSAAAPAFAAARFAMDLKPSDALLPSATPLRAVYDAADPKPSQTVVVQPPARGRLQLDGQLTLQRATDRPTFVQFVSADGAVTYTGYLQPADPLPKYVPLEPGAASDWSYDRHGSAAPLWAATGVSAVAAGSLYGLAMSERGQYYADQPEFDQLDAHRARANTYGAASVVTAALAAGLGLTATFAF